MGTLSVNLLDKVNRITKFLCTCGNTTTTYATLTRLLHFSNLSAALIVTLSFNRTFNPERNLTTCSEGVSIVYPKNIYQTQETFFDKWDSFGIQYTNEQKLFKNLAIFDFESMCVQEESFKDTVTPTNPPVRIGKHIPFSVSFFLKSCEK